MWSETEKRERSNKSFSTTYGILEHPQTLEFIKLSEKPNNNDDSLAPLPSVGQDLECAFLVSLLGSFVPNSPYTPIWKTVLELSWKKDNYN